MFSRRYRESLARSPQTSTLQTDHREWVLTTNRYFIVIAQHREAYAELCHLITHCRRQAPKAEYPFTPDDLMHFARVHSAAMGSGNLGIIPHTDACFTPNLSMPFQSRLVAATRSYTGRKRYSTTRSHTKPCVTAGNLPIIASSRAPGIVQSEKMLHDCLCHLSQSVRPLDSRPIATQRGKPSQTHSTPEEVYTHRSLQHRAARAAVQPHSMRFCPIQYPEEVLLSRRSANEYLRELRLSGSLSSVTADLCFRTAPEKVRLPRIKELRRHCRARLMRYYFLDTLLRHCRLRLVAIRDTFAEVEVWHAQLCCCLLSSPGITAVGPDASKFVLFGGLFSKRRARTTWHRRSVWKKWQA